MLEHRISAADIDRLVLTRGYERLLSVAGSLTGLDVGTQRLLNGLLSLEIQQRITALDQAAKDLDTQIQLWSGFAEFTIPDISVYSEHDDKLEDLDFPAAICAPRRQPVRVIVPMIILDELDGLKNRTPSPHGKWRAAYTLGVMDKAFTNTALPGLFLAPVAANPVSGGVFLDVVFDPRSRPAAHRRRRDHRPGARRPQRPPTDLRHEPVITRPPRRTPVHSS